MAQTTPITVNVEFGNACFTHCCPRHGCKYGFESDFYYPNKVCPISEGLSRPKYPRNNGCEMCEPEFAAIAAAKKHAEAWNLCDPQSSISADAAAEIALAAIIAYNQSTDLTAD